MRHSPISAAQPGDSPCQSVHCSQVNGSMADDAWQCLGTWAMAGTVVTVTVPGSVVSAGGATLHIGGWTDTIYKKADWPRLPQIVSVLRDCFAVVEKRICGTCLAGCSPLCPRGNKQPRKYPICRFVGLTSPPQPPRLPRLWAGLSTFAYLAARTWVSSACKSQVCYCFFLHSFCGLELCHLSACVRVAI